VYAGTLQMDIIPKQKEANLNFIDSTLAQTSQRVDLLVLPEFFTTGIFFTTKEEFAALAEPIPHGPTCHRLADIARRHQTTLVGSIIEQDGDRLYNTAIVVNPSGYMGKQRKRHLPDYEKQFFDSGDEIHLFEVNGVRLGILICFECWVPEACRALAAMGAQMICHTANIMSSATYEALRVRAIENATPIICANRIGSETQRGTTWSFRGESRIIDADGQVLSQLDNGPGLHVISLDPTRFHHKGNEDCSNLMDEMRKYKSFYETL
jgi:predicted amidohydrolase